MVLKLLAKITSYQISEIKQYWDCLSTWVGDCFQESIPSPAAIEIADGAL